MRNNSAISEVLQVPRSGDFYQITGLVDRELRLLAFQVPLRLRNAHAFAGAHSDQVGFELGTAVAGSNAADET
jgi:hypothetical protein